MSARMKLREAIVGVLFLATLALAKQYSHHWLYVTAALAALMVVNSFAGICPVTYLLGKLMPDKPPAPAGS